MSMSTHPSRLCRLQNSPVEVWGTSLGLQPSGHDQLFPTSFRCRVVYGQHGMAPRKDAWCDLGTAVKNGGWTPKGRNFTEINMSCSKALTVVKLWYLWFNATAISAMFFFSGPVLDMLGSRSQAHRDENRLAWYHGRRKRGYVEWLRQAAKLSVKELWHLWTRIQRTDTWRSWPWKTTKLNLEWGLNSVCKLFFQQLGAPGLNELIQAAPAIHTGLQTMATMPWFSIHWFSSGYG